MALEIPKPLDSSVLNEAFDRGMPHVLMSDAVFMQYRDFIYIGLSLKRNNNDKLA